MKCGERHDSAGEPWRRAADGTGDRQHVEAIVGARDNRRAARRLSPVGFPGIIRP